MSCMRTDWDPIPILEALYDLEQPRGSWFRGVLDAAGFALDRGLGVGMLLYDVSGSAPRVEARTAVRRKIKSATAPTIRGCFMTPRSIGL